MVDTAEADSDPARRKAQAEDVGHRVAAGVTHALGEQQEQLGRLRDLRPARRRVCLPLGYTSLHLSSLATPPRT